MLPAEEYFPRADRRSAITVAPMPTIEVCASGCRVYYPAAWHSQREIEVELPVGVESYTSIWTGHEQKGGQ